MPLRNDGKEIGCLENLGFFCSGVVVLIDVPGNGVEDVESKEMPQTIGGLCHYE